MLDAFALICGNLQQGDKENKNTDLEDLESLLAQEEEAEEDGLFENEQYKKRLAKEAQEAKENNLAEVELLVKESLEAVITNTTNNNNTIAPLATKPVTPEKDRKKKESESQSETESTGLCGGRRYVSDLNSLDPTTKFPTNWMSDRADYDSEATVDDNERYCLDKSESGDVRAINVKDDVDFLRQRLLAEEKEKEILDAAIEKKIRKNVGYNIGKNEGKLNN